MPALFLDRDGVIIEDVHFIRRPEDVQVIGDVAQAIAAANARGVAVVVVTNQSGVARGHFDWPAFQAVEDRLAQELAARGASVDLVLACGYHPDGVSPLGMDHPWRKPQRGMLLEAARILGVALERSIIVGDRLTDLAAGKAAGLPRGGLVLTGYGRSEAEANWAQIVHWREMEDFDVRVTETAAGAITQWLAEI
jgi:D-glycero-D-manno-heptose 1,7-bisphosphate phosphatase